MFLSSAYLLEAQGYASIEVGSVCLPGKISSKLFGSFIEYVHHWVNSPLGLSAQEIQNRGFDIDMQGFPIAKYWEGLPSDNVILSLEEGGYNPNGKYYQLIDNRGGAEAGISQKIWMNSNTEYEFYVYVKGDSSCAEINFSLQKSDSVYFSGNLGLPGNNWEKRSIIIPAFDSLCSAELMISFSGKGRLCLDEASLLPVDNKFGIRKEYYDVYKYWAPGIIRFPGGYFADTELARWEYGIGDIDKRESPNYDGEYPQRFEIGTDEFVSFCRDIGAGPHLVVNLKNATASEAADWLEYCNLGAETEYGSKRIANGYEGPHDVKYWEIGNEQWSEPDWMANRFLSYYSAMKAKDESIELFIDGYVEQALPYFLTVMDVAAPYTDYYSWHYSQKIDENKYSDDRQIYLSLAANTVIFENYINDIERWARKYYPDSEIKQAVTEAWTFYNNWEWYRNERLFTMETAIWTALINNMAMRHCNSLDILERTHNSGCFFAAYTPDSNRRVIVPTPTLYACAMQRKHSGGTALAINVDSPEFDMPEMSGSPAVSDVPWIDATASAGEDSIFISIVNRHPDVDFNIALDLSKLNIRDEGKIYRLESDNITDGPTIEDAYKVVPVSDDFIYDGNLTIRPHSLAIIALPCDYSIGEARGRQSIKISPVPAGDYVRIDFTKPVLHYGNLLIYDMMGNIVHKELLRYGETGKKIDTVKLAGAMYKLVYITTTELLTETLIICR